MAISDRIKDILLEWATEMSDEMRESLTRHDHVDAAGAGNLYQSATVSPEWIQDEEGDAFRLKIVLPFYAEYLNDGTRPSAKKPSRAFIDSLTNPNTGWIARSGKVALSLKRSFTDSKGKQRTQTFKTKGDAANSFAWSLATKRLKTGSPASHWFDEVWGGNPVPENSEAVLKLQRLLLQLAGDAQFFLEIIDPNKPDKKI